MHSGGLRATSNEHLFGEPEQDANSALTELDKGWEMISLNFSFNSHVNFDFYSANNKK